MLLQHKDITEVAAGTPQVRHHTQVEDMEPIVPTREVKVARIAVTNHINFILCRCECINLLTLYQSDFMMSVNRSV